MKLPSLSIIIPCYNVQSTVEYVVANAYRVGKKISRKLEIIVVDDASSDNTARILNTLKKTVKCLRVITHKKNCGYGKTIKELYTQAKNAWIFSLPGDDQFEASEIEKLVPFTQNSDMILGYRIHRHDPKNRLVQSSVYNRLLNLLFGLSLCDVNTIRLMKRSSFLKISLTSDSAFVDAELAICMKKNAMKTVEIPILHKERKDKSGSGGKFFKTILPTIIDMILHFFSS